jgi:integrase/recombinase XerC
MEKQFLDYLRHERRYSEHTIQSYENDLLQFKEYIDAFEEAESIDLAQAHVVRNWIVELMDQGYAVRSVQRKISTLKSFFKFLKRTGKRSDNPVSAIYSPKSSKRLPHFVDGKGMKDLFWNEGLFEDDFTGIRDKVMLMTFYGTGMRLAELIGLTDADLELASGTLKVLGKRNKERVVPLGKELMNLLRGYMEVKDQKFPNVDSLFVLDSGKKLYPKFVYRKVNEYLGRVTTLSKRSPHVLRHTFATHMLENGAELQSIKEILGHASLAATQIYTHNSIDRLKKIHTQAHPRG